MACVDACVFDAHNEVSFVGLHRFTFDGDKFGRQLSDLRAGIGGYAGFFKQLAPGGVFECLARFALSASSHPKRRAARHIEAEHERAPLRIEHDDARSTAEAFGGHSRLALRHARLNRDRMDPLTNNIAKRRNYCALARKPVHLGKGGRFDHHGEMRFAGAIIADMAGMLCAVIDDLQMRRRKGIVKQLRHLIGDGSRHFRKIPSKLILAFGAARPILKPLMPPSKFHGRHEGVDRRCERPGCTEAGEFRAPGNRASGFDGPGEWRWFCLEHVREFNAGYDWFEGMSADEILSAQSPVSGWRTESPGFSQRVHVDGMPRWSDFDDPLDAISARAAGIKSKAQRQADVAPGNFGDRRFSKVEAEALETMGLGLNTDKRRLRRRYSELVRRYHPDRNGGDRRYEARLAKVVEAYQLLRESAALTQA